MKDGEILSRLQDEVERVLAPSSPAERELRSPLVGRAREDGRPRRRLQTE